MKFEILTIFPDFFRGPLDYGIVRRAREAGLIDTKDFFPSQKDWFEKTLKSLPPEKSK